MYHPFPFFFTLLSFPSTSHYHIFLLLPGFARFIPSSPDYRPCYPFFDFPLLMNMFPQKYASCQSAAGRRSSVDFFLRSTSTPITLSKRSCTPNVGPGSFGPRGRFADFGTSLSLQMPPSKFYDDPQDDLVVESSDHHESRVSSAKLATMSDFFEGMLHVGQDGK